MHRLLLPAFMILGLIPMVHPAPLGCGKVDASSDETENAATIAGVYRWGQLGEMTSDCAFSESRYSEVPPEDGTLSIEQEGAALTATVEVGSVFPSIEMTGLIEGSRFTLSITETEAPPTTGCEYRYQGTLSGETDPFSCDLYEATYETVSGDCGWIIGSDRESCSLSVSTSCEPIGAGVPEGDDGADDEGEDGDDDDGDDDDGDDDDGNDDDDDGEDDLEGDPPSLIGTYYIDTSMPSSGDCAVGAGFGEGAQLEVTQGVGEAVTGVVTYPAYPADSPGSTYSGSVDEAEGTFILTSIYNSIFTDTGDTSCLQDVTDTLTGTVDPFSCGTREVTLTRSSGDCSQFYTVDGATGCTETAPLDCDPL